MFGSEQIPLKLIKEVPTRWNSTYFLLTRFMTLCPLVNNVLIHPEIMKSQLIVGQDTLNIIHLAINAFEPIQQVSEEMSGEKYATISSVIPLSRLLKQEAKRLSATCVISAKILEYLNQYFNNTEESYRLAAATFLDPRFKQYAFKDPRNVDVCINRLKTEFRQQPSATPATPAPTPTTTQSVTKKRSIWASFDAEIKLIKESQPAVNVQQHVEIDIYRREEILDRTEDPLAWWQRQEKTMPELKRLAMKYLCCPATSTPAERCFSKAGELVSQRRANLSDENIKKVLFLNKNI